MNIFYLERKTSYQDSESEEEGIELELIEPLAIFAELNEALEYNKFLNQSESNYNVSYYVRKETRPNK